MHDSSPVLDFDLNMEELRFPLSCRRAIDWLWPTLCGYCHKRASKVVGRYRVLSISWNRGATCTIMTPRVCPLDPISSDRRYILAPLLHTMHGQRHTTSNCRRLDKASTKTSICTKWNGHQVYTIDFLRTIFS